MTTILPEINFLNVEPQVIVDDVIRAYEELENRKLSKSDPLRIIFLAMASIIAKQNININDAAKQNLLYYSRKDILDHKGYAWTTDRLGSDYATTIVRFHILKDISGAKIIKKGSLLTHSEASLMFKTLEDIVIPPDATFVDARVECTQSGTKGNGLAPGELDRMVSPLYFVSKVENLTESDGGTEPESDDDYRERIRQAPETLSTAGPDEAYEYFAKKASSAVGDVVVSSPNPGEVDIKVLLKNGEIPSQEVLDGVYEMVTSRKVKPLTDLVSVGPPIILSYDLNLTYYLSSSSTDKSLIQKNIETAIERWIIWQSNKIGRDINPSKLISECIGAGAKRVEVSSPIFTPIDRSSIAKLGAKNIIFGGIEDD